MSHLEIISRPAGEKRKFPWGTVIGLVLAVLVLLAALALAAAVSWVNKNFGIKFDELLYTITTPLKGADSGLVRQALHASGTQILLGLLYLFALTAVLTVSWRYTVTYRSEKKGSRDVMKLCRRGLMWISGISLVAALVFTERSFEIIDYIVIRTSPSTLYEDYYVDPLSVEVTGQGKNLIYVYMESMETTYASQEAGGHQPSVNYIQGLTDLAEENINFSNSEKLGGFRPINGTTWTMASLLATTSGVPYSFPVGNNNMSKWDKFAPGLTNLGDILEEKGYRCEFLCGSDADFGGRRNYFEQHGNYKIFDLFSARQKEYIPSNYRVWWGYEDMYLYEIARDELTDLAQGDQPFCFTMLTVDTHHINGYVCELCENEYDVVTANVVSCADRQVMDFLSWCEQQDFYDDCTIIISGDHPRMDTYLVENVEYSDRTVYNCFINSAKEPQGSTSNREFTAMDMFPTILSAMGFDVEGNRLGLGTDLLSGEPTLCEQLSFDGLEAETRKYSKFYEDHFN